LTVGAANKKPKPFGGLGLGAAVHDKEGEIKTST
jgi:hypothetical protein